MKLSKEATNVRFFPMKNKLEWKKCFRNDLCTEPPIGSHSVQENRFLNRIAENGQVLYLQQKIKNGQGTYEFIKRGIGLATTFPGFCKTHDRVVFLPIEKKGYKTGNKEQEFLFAYRAFSFEYQAKKSYYRLIEHYYDLLDKKDIKTLKDYFLSVDFNDESIENFKKVFLAHLNQNKEPLENVENIRKVLNDKLDNKCFSDIVTRTFVFPEEYKFAVSNAFYLAADHLGNVINGDNEDIISTLTVVPEKNKTIVLFSYPKQHKKKFSPFMKYITKSNLLERKKIFSSLIAIYTENIALNPKLWDSMGKEQQEFFYYIFDSFITDKPAKFPTIDLNLFIK